MNIWFTAKIIGMMTAGADFKGLLAIFLRLWRLILCWITQAVFYLTYTM